MAERWVKTRSMHAWSDRPGPEGYVNVVEWTPCWVNMALVECIAESEMVRGGTRLVRPSTQDEADDYDGQHFEDAPEHFLPDHLKMYPGR